MLIGVKMRKNSKYIVLVLSLVFCLAAIAFGQETTGSIEGTVKDSTVAIVPNVSVTIKSTTGTGAGTTTTGVSQGFNRTVQTDSAGFFRLLTVPPGTYVVTTAATAGF